MENKINIAELLRDCPSGMELDCASYDNVSFDKISDDKKATYPIFCYITDKEGNRSGISFTENGCESKRYGAKCVIFPKGKTTWEGFVPPCKFKDGDIIYVKDKYNNEWCSILSNDVDDKLYTYVDFCINNNIFYHNKPDILCKHKYIIEYRLATEKEKAKLFKAIKDNSYKWNPETKTLEKLVVPKFKVGDRIRHKNDKTIIRTINYIYHFNNSYGLCDNHLLFFKEQDNYELVPNKFDINTLKPFDRVLVRLTNNCVWMPKFFSYYDTGSKLKYYPFIITDNIGYPQCIPYEKNEYLSNTTEDYDEFYKTWK